MRIVAGTAKGRRLAVPSRGTRPTSDRAREALFSSLGALVDLTGARVLDLFAGSGAVGLEALSRGAGHVTFVESDRSAAETLACNAGAVDGGDTAIVRTTAESFLSARADGHGGSYLLVFADPPYAYPEDALSGLLTNIVDNDLVQPAGVVVVERSARSPEPQWPTALEPVKHRRYGEGTLWYGRRR
jgi:16S rRNA (guanine966-N2)-methyltransferase